MIIEKTSPKCISFAELEIGECFAISNSLNASVLLKIYSDNGHNNAVNLTSNTLIEISSNVAVIPLKATLTISEK